MNQNCQTPESEIISLMDKALLAAREAANSDDVPVGAVIYELTPPFSIVAVSGNRREQDQDPSAHAEICALRMASEKIKSWNLTGHGIVVTLEPCPMCMGALVNARIGELWFGAYDSKGGAISLNILCPQKNKLNHRFPWVGGINKDSCGGVLSEFFKAKRSQTT